MLYFLNRQKPCERVAVEVTKQNYTYSRKILRTLLTTKTNLGKEPEMQSVQESKPCQVHMENTTRPLAKILGRWRNKWCADKQ